MVRIETLAMKYINFFSNKNLKASKSDGYGPSWPLSFNDLAPHYSALETFLKVHGNKDNINEVPDGRLWAVKLLTEI